MVESELIKVFFLLTLANDVFQSMSVYAIVRAMPTRVFLADFG